MSYRNIVDNVITNMNRNYIHNYFNKIKVKNPKLSNKYIEIYDDTFTPMTTFTNNDYSSNYKIKMPMVYDIQRKMFQSDNIGYFNYCKCSDDTILSCKKDIILHVFKETPNKDVFIGYFKQKIKFNDCYNVEKRHYSDKYLKNENKIQEEKSYESLKPDYEIHKAKISNKFISFITHEYTLGIISIFNIISGTTLIILSSTK